jgi:hypothetical protein
LTEDYIRLQHNRELLARVNAVYADELDAEEERLLDELLIQKCRVVEGKFWAAGNVVLEQGEGNLPRQNLATVSQVFTVARRAWASTSVRCHRGEPARSLMA